MERELWFDRGAADWNEALPLGNGSLGAMVFGGEREERLALNEESLWAGPPVPENRPEAREGIREAAALLREGKAAEAEAVLNEKSMGTRIAPRSYQPLGDLRLRFLDMETETLRRSLDLAKALSLVIREDGNGSVRQSCFVSRPAGALVLRLSCRGVRRSLVLSLSRREERRFREPDYRPEGAPDEATVEQEGRGLALSGQVSHGEAHKGVRFLSLLQIRCDGELIHREDGLLAENFSELLLVLDCETSFGRGLPPYEGWTGDRPGLLRRLEALLAKGYEELEAEHLAEYRPYFEGCSLELKAPAPALPLDRRLEEVKKGAPDPGLGELLFHYARYLLISSSRPGTLCANLQGIWNDLFEAPWNADYHININIQMIYWLAEIAGLESCHRPLFDLAEALLPDGRKTAREVYGCRGFVGHHTTDGWYWSRLMGEIRWGVWPMGGAWLALHFAEHYRHNPDDKEFLTRRALPFLEENILFFLDFLDKDPQGRWETPLSTSPENAYLDDAGETRFLCRGSAMDQEILWELFHAYLELSEGLAETEILLQARRVFADLKRPAFGPEGRILEWGAQREEAEPGHRHISHLFGLFPGTLFFRERKEDYRRGAQKVIARRLANGGGHTGWSMSWLMAFRARLGEGEELETLLTRLLCGSTYPNLLDSHPPFQLDGNIGSAAALAEGIIQSHQEREGRLVLSLLPALLPSWAEGRCRGFRCRGGLKVDLAWRGGEPLALKVENPRKLPLLIRWAGKELLRRESVIRLGREDFG